MLKRNVVYGRKSQLYVSHMCKIFLDSNFNEAVIDKISNFHEIAPNSTYSHESEFLKYICNFLDQLLLPNKFHGRDLSEILFFIFATCEPLRSSTFSAHFSHKGLFKLCCPPKASCFCLFIFCLHFLFVLILV